MWGSIPFMCSPPPPHLHSSSPQPPLLGEAQCDTSVSTSTSIHSQLCCFSHLIRIGRPLSLLIVAGRGREIPLIPPMASLPGFAFSFIPLPPSLSLAHELRREESATVAECKKGEESGGGGGPKTSLSLSLLSASPPLSLSLSLHSLLFRSSCLQRTKHRLSLPPPSATPLLPPLPLPPLSCVGTHRQEGLATGGKRRRRRKVGRREVHSLASFGVGRREGGREGT